MGSQTQQLYMYSEAKRDRATMAEVIDNFKIPIGFVDEFLFQTQETATWVRAFAPQADCWMFESQPRQT